MVGVPQPIRSGGKNVTIVSPTPFPSAVQRAPNVRGACSPTGSLLDIIFLLGQLNTGLIESITGFPSCNQLYLQIF